MYIYVYIVRVPSTTSMFRNKVQYVYGHVANTGAGRQRESYNNDNAHYRENFPVLQPTTAEDILYRRVNVSTCRKQRTHVLRGVGEAHIL